MLCFHRPCIHYNVAGERKRIKIESEKSPSHSMGGSKDQHNLSAESGSSGSSLVDSKASLRRSTELPSCQMTGGLTPSINKQQSLGGHGQAGIGSGTRMKSPLAAGSAGSSASSGAGGTPSSTGSNRSQMQVSPQCQYPALSQSTSPYSHMQGSSPEQVYYPHHNNMVAMQMAAANSSSGLLQPVVTSSLMATQQMASCQLAGQSSACALSSSTSQGLGYNGLASSTGSHASLPSCTYMQNQSSSHSAYQGHLASNMMNIATAAHYPGSLA